MDQAFVDMMKWSLGDDYEKQNVKQAPNIWKEKHPDMPPLLDMMDKPSGLNAYYYVFQLTAFWLAAHDLECCIKRPSAEVQQEKNKKESQNDESFRAILRVIWSDFLSCFKRKSRS